MSNFEFQAGPTIRCAVRIAQALAIILFAPIVVYGATISGVVHNKTTNRPDAGDDVVLIGLTRNMQELARSRTNATGHYAIDLPDSGMHLIRVDHEKAAYFAPVAPGTTHVDVDVYDVGTKVKGVTTEADTLRLETDAQGLHVVESYFVSNASTPPRTQFGSKAYEIYLPAAAQLESAIAMGPGGMPVASSPVPAGDKGHYAFIFPIRPGETHFQVNYRLPYGGDISFQPRVSLPTANLAVILPKSMRFNAGSSPFQPVNDDPNAQTFVVKNVGPSQTPAFSIAGNGTLPADSSQSQGSSGQSDSSAPTSAASDTRPGIGLGAPIDTPDPLSKYKWWILSGVGLILVIGAAFFLRSGISTTSKREPSEYPPLTTEAAAPPRNVWLAGLKEELFALETERLQKKIAEEEYRAQRMALDVLLKRTLSRQSPPPSQSDMPKPISATPDTIGLAPQTHDA
jgi:hypothetical protein